MKRVAWFIAGFLFLVAGVARAQGASAGRCPPEGYSKEALLEIKSAGFTVADNQQRNTLAIALMSCLAEPDPVVRDGLAFEAVSTWLRGQQLSAPTILALYENLVGQLSGKADPRGFRQPFAALLLSEVARADRIEAVLTPAMRADLVTAAASYLVGVDDYRGFSDTEGWRHGVAHGSDLVLQLVLNPAIDANQVERLMEAVAVQVAPAGNVFYVYGEPGRLARAVYYAYVRNIIPAAFWQAWFAGVSSAQPLETWADSYSSQAGLAKRHNTLSFLLALHFNAGVGGDEQGAALGELTLQAITAVSGG